MKVNIAILNYNGRVLLEECLPSILEAVKASKHNVFVTVLDNCSTDGSIDFLRQAFPGIKVYVARKNKVYCSYNEFFKNCDDDIVVILNSDIKVDKNFLDPLVENFKDPDVFFVSSRMYFFDGVTYQGDKSKASVRLGIISADTRFKGYETLIMDKSFTFSTGNGAFDRKKFLELGGFDELYLPGRYEDVDFCFRGWKSGFKGIYEPASVIYHKGYASFKVAFSDKEIQKTVFRNSLLFMWKNITDKKILFEMHFWLLPRLVLFMLTFRFYFLKGFLEALSKLPEILRIKKNITKNFKRTDRQVLNIVG
ncbi:MAG: glycosyltransferase [Candidatus Omnitrophica bacterium]|nr:glycosyltransferase [Candidatus Omnitrophota bacterium]